MSNDYTSVMVRNLLTQYLTLREFLWEGTATQSPITQYVRKSTLKDLPLGATNTNPFPFQEKNHASSRLDGKRRARAREELLVMVVDLEEGLKELSQHDQAILTNYFILDRLTLEDIATKKGQTIAAASLLVWRILDRLTERMNNATAKRT